MRPRSLASVSALRAEEVTEDRLKPWSVDPRLRILLFIQCLLGDSEMIPLVETDNVCLCVWELSQSEPLSR